MRPIAKMATPQILIDGVKQRVSDYKKVDLAMQQAKLPQAPVLGTYLQDTAILLEHIAYLESKLRERTLDGTEA